MSRLAVLLLAACGGHAARDARSVAAPDAAPPALDVAVAAATPPDAAAPQDPCLTSSDLAEVCGYADAYAADPEEGAAGGPLCARGDGRSSFPRITVHIWRIDAEDARRRWDAPTKSRGVGGGWIEATPLALGDAAELVHDHTAMESQNILLRVLRGADYLEVFQHAADGRAPACTDEQLGALGRRALERLEP